MHFIRYTGQIKNKIDRHGYFQYKDNIVEVISAPWDRYNNVIMRNVCHAHLSSSLNSKIDIPFKNIWYDCILGKVDKQEKLCLLVNAHLYTLVNENFISFLRAKYKNCYIVLYFSDTYKYFCKNYRGFPSMAFLKSKLDFVLTYNVVDAKQYDLKLMRPAFPNYLSVKDNYDIVESDFFFVGQNKGRLNDLIKIYETCKKRNLVCDFYITGVNPDDFKYPEIIHYNTTLTYEEVLERVKKTKCVVNIVQSNTQGITMRDYEALGNGKMLLTNNYYLESMDFFNPRQVVWIDNLENEIDKMFNNLPKETVDISSYNEEGFYIWLNGIISNK